MSKKKKKKIDEQKFLETLDKVTQKLANKFKFGYHTYEDIKQQAAVFALQALEKYDESRPLENFLWVHIRNRLFNYKRDNYRRPDNPCVTCPFYDKHFKNSDNQCTEFKNKNDCSLYDSFDKRNSDKKNIMQPTHIDHINPSSAKNDPSDINSNNQLLETIDKYMPTQYRELYLKYRYGEKISKNNQKKIVEIIQDILKNNDTDT